MKAEKIKQLNAVVDFSIYSQREIEKSKRIEMAKRQISNKIADLIFKEFQDLPIEFEELKNGMFDGHEEYKLTMHVIDRDYLKELIRLAEIGRYTEMAFNKGSWLLIPLEKDLDNAKDLIEWGKERGETND